MQVRSRSPWWRSQELKVAASLIGLLSILLLIYWKTPTFFTSGNVFNLLRQVAINGIIASGMTIVMIGGGFDLSVGAVLALSGVLAIQLAKTNVWFGMLCPVALGAGAGLVNGILVSRFAINPLIVTLASRYLVYASANLLTAGFIQYNRNPTFLVLGRSSPGGIPAPAIVFLSVAMMSHLILNHSTLGAALFAVGSNERAAFFSGLPSRNLQTVSYAATGACAALAGVVLASRLGVAPPDAGEGYELDAIAAVVVGGTSILGGAGSIQRTLAGVLLLGVLSNLLVLSGQSYEIQRIATGLIIVLAVAFDLYRRGSPR
jgi:ribose/xylose/arabinose/galactoside ABC-type transport system permease subunit